MSSAGHIIDAINRIKQNRALKASKRQKFKGSNRDSIYSDSDNVQKAIFKKVSKEKAQAVIKKIRQDFKLKRKRDLIFIGTFSLIFITLIIVLNLPNTSTENSSLDNEYNSTRVKKEKIKWNGKISEPLKIENTEYYYIPILHNISGELDEHGFYNLNYNNMVGERTRNVLFIDKECTIIGKLLNKDGLIFHMEVLPNKDNNLPKNIFYTLYEEDSNKDELIDTKDNYAYYISDVNGENLLKITDEPLVSINLREGNLILEYYKTKNSKENSKENSKYEYYKTENPNDTIYGIYNLESKELKFTNQLDSIN